MFVLRSQKNRHAYDKPELATAACRGRIPTNVFKDPRGNPAPDIRSELIGMGIDVVAICLKLST
jgi:hypothetical protein